jgi:hypothetical protein
MRRPGADMSDENAKRKKKALGTNAILGIVLLVVIGVLGLIGLSMGPAATPEVLSADSAS